MGLYRLRCKTASIGKFAALSDMDLMRAFTPLRPKLAGRKPQKA